ncbi:MAG: RDD family protein [bacterium]
MDPENNQPVPAQPEVQPIQPGVPAQPQIQQNYPQQPYPQQPMYAPQYPQGAPAYTYAGFWLRFLAYFIDSIIISIVSIIPISILIAVMSASLVTSTTLNSSDSTSVQYGATYFIILFISYIVYPALVFVYYAFMESSKFQGTPGKIILGIIVTDENGQKLTFAHAFGRNLGKILSSLILSVGYIMAGFTDKKQALHDILAKTLVLKRI